MQDPANPDDRRTHSIHDREGGIGNDPLAGAGSLTFSADERIEDQQLSRVTDALRYPVCRLNIVLCDIRPSIEVVAIRAR
jgi:hypothetical protein